MGLKTVPKYLIKLNVRAVLKNHRKQGLVVQFSEILNKKEGRTWQYFDERFVAKCNPVQLKRELPGLPKGIEPDRVTHLIESWATWGPQPDL